MMMLFVPTKRKTAEVNKHHTGLVLQPFEADSEAAGEIAGEKSSEGQ